MRFITTLTMMLLFLIADQGRSQVLPRWDFQQERELHYRMTHETVGTLGDDRMEATVEGDIRIRAADGRGDLRMEMRQIRTVIGGEELPEDAQPPQTQTATILEDGRLQPARYAAPANLQLLLDLMLPLPEEPLDPEQPVSHRMVLPAMGMPDLEGEAVFTLQGHEQVDDRRLLKYHVKCDLQSGEADDAFASGSLTAEIVCLFDEAEGRFHRVDTTATMRIMADQEMRISQEQKFTVQYEETREN
jgi:hypothetical protein